eukprot:m.92288 g.92288  ORF g.92288 m.92288 type:complete len:290 (+) comp8887_c1_seq1:71-940(+)
MTMDVMSREGPTSAQEQTRSQRFNKKHNSQSRKKKVDAAFGSNSHRFSVAGISPRAKKVGTCISSTYAIKNEETKLGPGCYNIHYDETSKAAMHSTYKIQGSEWDRTDGNATTMHLGHSSHHRKARKERNSEARNLGPGHYNTKEFNSYGKIPMSLSQSTKRFHKLTSLQETLPGPGGFSDAIEKRDKYLLARKNASTKAIMDSKGRGSELFGMKDDKLAPNRYCTTVTTFVSTNTGKKSIFHTDTPRFLEVCILPLLLLFYISNRHVCSSCERETLFDDITKTLQFLT